MDIFPELVKWPVPPPPPDVPIAQPAEATKWLRMLAPPPLLASAMKFGGPFAIPVAVGGAAIHLIVIPVMNYREHKNTEEARRAEHAEMLKEWAADLPPMKIIEISSHRHLEEAQKGFRLGKFGPMTQLVAVGKYGQDLASTYRSFYDRLSKEAK